MSSTISATTATTPVTRVTSATSTDSNAAELAAMQKVLVSLQKQLGEPGSSSNPDDETKRDLKSDERKEMAKDIRSVKLQIATLRHHFAKESRETHEAKAAEAIENASRPVRNDTAQREQAEAEREAAAKAKAVENGSSVGTNVDTYA